MLSLNDRANFCSSNLRCRARARESGPAGSYEGVRLGVLWRCLDAASVAAANEADLESPPGRANGDGAGEAELDAALLQVGVSSLSLPV